MLMRLYDKLNSAQPEKIGIVSEMADLAGLDVAALPAARVFSFGVKDSMEDETEAEIRAAACEAGAKVFLYMQGSANVLDKDLKEMSAAMAETVTAGGYEGLILDIPEVPVKKMGAITDMVRLLKTALGEMPVYLVTEAPGRGEKSDEGYDYAALAAAADKLILKPAALEQVTKEFAVAPVDPLEEIYYGAASVAEQIGVDQVSVMLDSGLYKWAKSSRSVLDETELEELLEAETTETYYSDRYACAYLTNADNTNMPVTVWYLLQEDVAARVQLIRSMGISQICISDWDAANEAFLAGLN
jgi:spore germination protein YaaH